MSDNPTALTLLKMGCTITFPSGYSLTGDPGDGYVRMSGGLEELSRDGVRKAIGQWRHNYEKENEE